MEVNKIYNMDCLEGMKQMEDNSVDLILTSPPYNMTERTDSYNGRYDIYYDKLSDKEYINWTIEIFKHYQRVLVKKGVIAYNLSYSHENPSLPFILISEIIKKTDFVIADTVIWEKNNALPLSTSPTKLTRICEFVFIFVRKKHLFDFNCYKEKSKINDNTQQQFYKVYYNKIKTNNNNLVTDENKATFSVEFCRFFIKLYSKENDLVMDNFMGTGTTARECKNRCRNFIGFEISDKQCEIANKRLSQSNLLQMVEEINSNAPSKEGGT